MAAVLGDQDHMEAAAAIEGTGRSTVHVTVSDHPQQRQGQKGNGIQAALHRTGSVQHIPPDDREKEARPLISRLSSNDRKKGPACGAFPF